MNKRVSLCLLLVFLVILSITFLSVKPIKAQEPDGDNNSEFPAIPTSTLALSGAGWVEEISTVKTKAVLAAQAPVDCNVLSPPVVGYEVSRGQDLNDVVDFVNDLTASGYSVGTVDISLLGSIPPCVDILVVQGLANDRALPTVYTPAEGAMLQAWAAAGHGLMLSGDWGPLQAGTEALFQAYGYSQQGSNPVIDTTDSETPGLPPDNSWVIYQTDNFTSHPSLVGVNTIEMMAGSWFSPTTDAIVNADADAVPAGAPVVMAFNDAAGCVALFGDSNWVTSGAVTGGYAKEDNALLARQMITWLNSCTELTLTKTALPVVQAGQLLTYTLSVTNTSAAMVANVRLTDTVPAGTTFIDATSPHLGPDAGGVVVWPLNTLAGGASTTATMVVQVDNAVLSGTLVTNNADVTGNGGLTATAVITTLVTNPMINPILTKTVDPTQAQPGETVTFRLTVQQVGANSNATNAQIVDILPDGVDILDTQPTTGVAATSGQVLTWTIPALSPTQVETVTIQARINNLVNPLPATITNQALLSFDQGPDRSSNPVDIFIPAQTPTPTSTNTPTSSPTSTNTPTSSPTLTGTPSSSPTSTGAPLPISTSKPSNDNDDDDDDSDSSADPTPVPPGTSVAAATPDATPDLPVVYLPETGQRANAPGASDRLILSLGLLLLVGASSVILVKRR